MKRFLSSLGIAAVLAVGLFVGGFTHGYNLTTGKACYAAVVGQIDTDVYDRNFGITTRNSMQLWIDTCAGNYWVRSYLWTTDGTSQFQYGTAYTNVYNGYGQNGNPITAFEIDCGTTAYCWGDSPRFTWGPNIVSENVTVNPDDVPSYVHNDNWAPQTESFGLVCWSYTHGAYSSACI